MTRPLRPLFTVTHDADPAGSTEMVALAQPRHYGIPRRPWYVHGIPFRASDDEGRLLFRGTFYGHGVSDEKYDPLCYAPGDQGATRLEYYGRDVIDGRLGWHGPEMIGGA